MRNVGESYKRACFVFLPTRRDIRLVILETKSEGYVCMHNSKARKAIIGAGAARIIAGRKLVGWKLKELLKTVRLCQNHSSTELRDNALKELAGRLAIKFHTVGKSCC